VTAPPTSAPATADPAAAVAEQYFDALQRADEADAVDLACGLLDSGLSAAEVLLRLVVPAQTQVGVMWQTGRWNVAQEHAATCIAERVVDTVGARTRRGGGRGHVVLGCLDGEWHALAARIVGEVLRSHGWSVTFLGASVPPTHLVSFLQQHGPDVVALSAATPIHLPVAHRTIVAVQRTGTPVLVGGPGFGTDGRWARRLGVEAWAPTAADAVALLERPVPRSTASDDLRGVGHGTEYAGVRQRRGRLVVAGVERLRATAGPSGVPATTPGTLSDSPVDDDLGLVADYLAAAAYLEDRQLFTDHIRWLAAVAAHRGTAEVLPAVLDAFRSELHDFPFAQACLAEGHALLARQEGM
jgi:methanogenic corrinoid protein MtbC1